VNKAQKSANTNRSANTKRSAEYAASVLPGLEEVAGAEIVERLPDARLLDSARGWVTFRYAGNASDLFVLRTTEDVFALLYRTADLPRYRSGALPLLTRMARGSRHWDQAWSAFQRTRRRAVKRVTFRVIAQMSGKHGFRRQEVRDAVLAGIQSRRQARGWKPVVEDAHLEVWAPIVGDWALIALRLSDRRMRHRTYKRQHRPASLRPTLAAAMVYLSRPRASDRFCDPMCGAGTILAERAQAAPYQILVGGDLDAEALLAARSNLSFLADVLPPVLPASAWGADDLRSGVLLHEWDAERLSLRTGSLDVVVSNLPFGEQIGSHGENVTLYDRLLGDLARVLALGGRAVLLTSERELMRTLLRRYPSLHRERQVLVGVLGQAARIYLLRRI
jgi:23S rRNA G2445 N2-methylase RlmL